MLANTQRKCYATWAGHHPLPTCWRSRFVKSEKVISNNIFKKARHTYKHYTFKVCIARVRSMNEWNKSYLLYNIVPMVRYIQESYPSTHQWCRVDGEWFSLAIHICIYTFHGHKALLCFFLSIIWLMEFYYFSFFPRQFHHAQYSIEL